MQEPRTTGVLSTHTLPLQAAAAREAAVRLRAGELVVLPTETVYGLAANALDPAAVARIFAVKNRPADNPVIVHVNSIGMARDCAVDWPPLAESLARAFWPGPLTIVVRRAGRIPDIVTAGGPTVAVRWPAHPVIQAVIRECGFPLAAPSANLSTQLSPTTAAHVGSGLGGRVGLILDGGHCDVGIESTVVDVTSGRPVVLRPGMISEEALAAVAGPGGGGEPAVDAPAVPRSPGQRFRHYAPRARLEVRSWLDAADLLDQLRGRGGRVESVAVLCHARIPPPEAGFLRVSVIPHDPVAYARALYAELHQCDEAGAQEVIVETPPVGPDWQAIHDRLRRAAGR
ncbi:MAG: threonylcarbamoyl-AMP synthase [Verrucomicrobiales bacterium]|nr:threonylcarbamoyl-AMP synthase [Verrucomicrobiales bacterium]